MGTTHLSGLEVAGVPTMGIGGNLPMTVTPGQYFFVHSGTGNDGNTGAAGDPLATIDAAINKCTANRGDTIIVMQGHAETLDAASDIAADVAGINIIGLGTGADRPELTFSNTAATFAISAANVLVKNIVGISGVDLVVSPFLISGAGCTLGTADGPIEWQDPSSSLQAIRQVLTTTAANNLSINMKVVGITSGGTAPVNSVRLVGCDTGRIVLDFYGRASTAVVEFITTACTDVDVYGIVYNSGTTDGSKNVVDTQGSSTWTAQLFDGAAGRQVSGGSALPIFSSSAAPGFSWGGTRLSAKVISDASASLTTGASPVSLFTVTGTVIARVFAAIPTAITSTLNNGTLAVGVSGATSALLAAVTADGTNFPNNSVWTGDTSPTVACEVFSNIALNWALITNGADIIATVATNSMTAGAITFYCQWVPVSNGASVVAA